MTQWLVLGEKRYQLATFDDLELEDLDACEEQTGLTLDEIETELTPGRNPMKSRRGRQAFRAMVWMVRRVAGEELTVAEAVAGVPMGSFEIIDDAAAVEEDEDEDPTSPAGEPDATSE
jgi:hypothetical protein